MELQLGHNTALGIAKEIDALLFPFLCLECLLFGSPGIRGILPQTGRVCKELILHHLFK